MLLMGTVFFFSETCHRCCKVTEVNTLCWRKETWGYVYEIFGRKCTFH